MSSSIHHSSRSSIINLASAVSVLALPALALLLAAPAAAVPGAPEGRVAAGAKAETDTYVAEIRAPGAYKTGTEGVVVVTFAPKGEYHINGQFPYKFKAAPAPEGMTYPKPLLVRADGKFEEKQGTFTVPFTASKPGRTTVSGTLHLSVCSPANCIVDKVSLEIAVEVK